MKVEIEHEGTKQIEHINTQQQLLLRAAYIASFIKRSSNFPHGQKRDFEVLQTWPIEIPKEDRDEETQALIANINDWFECNLIQTTKTFIHHPLELDEMYKSICKAVSIPKEEQDIVPAWMLEEIFNRAACTIKKKAEKLLIKK